MDLKHISRNITDGRDRAGARAMYKAVGFTDADLAKPLNGDERLGEVGVGEADRFVHGARASPVASIGDVAADVFEIHEAVLSSQFSEKPKSTLLVRAENPELLAIVESQ